MFENSFRNIDQILHTDSVSATELDYVEQTSWILFLKYLDDLDEIKKTEAALAGKKYLYILDAEYRWDAWACPKTADKKIDYYKARRRRRSLQTDSVSHAGVYTIIPNSPTRTGSSRWPSRKSCGNILRMDTSDSRSISPSTRSVSCV